MPHIRIECFGTRNGEKNRANDSEADPPFAGEEGDGQTGLKAVRIS